MIVTLLLSKDSKKKREQKAITSQRISYSPELLDVFAGRVESVEVVQIRQCAKVARGRLHAVTNHHTAFTAAFDLEHFFEEEEEKDGASVYCHQGAVMLFSKAKPTNHWTMSSKYLIHDILIDRQSVFRSLAEKGLVAYFCNIAVLG